MWNSTTFGISTLLVAACAAIVTLQIDDASYFNACQGDWAAEQVVDDIQDTIWYIVLIFTAGWSLIWWPTDREKELRNRRRSQQINERMSRLSQRGGRSSSGDAQNLAEATSTPLLDAHSESDAADGAPEGAELSEPRNAFPVPPGPGSESAGDGVSTIARAIRADSDQTESLEDRSFVQRLLANLGGPQLHWNTAWFLATGTLYYLGWDATVRGFVVFGDGDTRLPLIVKTCGPLTDARKDELNKKINFYVYFKLFWASLVVQAAVRRHRNPYKMRSYLSWDLLCRVLRCKLRTRGALEGLVGLILAGLTLWSIATAWRGGQTPPRMILQAIALYAFSFLCFSLICHCTMVDGCRPYRDKAYPPTLAYYWVWAVASFALVWALGALFYLSVVGFDPTFANVKKESAQLNGISSGVYYASHALMWLVQIGILVWRREETFPNHVKPKDALTTQGINALNLRVSRADGPMRDIVPMDRTTVVT